MSSVPFRRVGIVAACGVVGALLTGPVGFAAPIVGTDADCPPPAENETRAVALEAELRGDGEVEALERTVTVGTEHEQRCLATDTPELDALPVLTSVLHRDQEGRPVELGRIAGMDGPVTTRVTVRDASARTTELTANGPDGTSSLEVQLGVPQLVRTTVIYPNGWQVTPVSPDAAVQVTSGRVEVRRTSLLFPPTTDPATVLEVRAAAGGGSPTVVVEAAPITDPDAAALFDDVGERDALAVLAALGELGADGGDELADGARQLADGTNEFAGGLTELADGTRLLADGLGEAAAGTEQLAAGGDQLAGGSAELAAGVRTYVDGAGELAGGVGQLAAGVAELDAGAQALTGGLGPLADGVAQLSGGIGEFAAQLGGAAAGAGDLAAGGQQLAAGTRELASGLEQLRAGITDALRDPSSIDEQMLRAIVTRLYELVTADLPPEVLEHLPPPEAVPIDPELLARLLPDLDPVADQVDATLGQLESGVGELADGAQALAAGQAELAAALEVAAGAGGELAAGADELAGGVDELIDGAQMLPDATGALADGSAQLAAGAGALADGGSELVAGAGTLADGIGQFADGIGEFAGATGEIVGGVEDLADGSDAAADGASDLADATSALADGAGELPTAFREAAQIADRAGQQDAELAALAAAGRERADDLRAGGSYAVRMTAAGSSPTPTGALALVAAVVLATVVAAAWWRSRRPSA